MLILNWFFSACIVQVGHAGSLYVNTTILLWLSAVESHNSDQAQLSLCHFWVTAVACFSIACVGG